MSTGWSRGGDNTGRNREKQTDASAYSSVLRTGGGCPGGSGEADGKLI